MESAPERVTLCANGEEAGRDPRRRDKAATRGSPAARSSSP